jgi:hypothetical protein
MLMALVRRYPHLMLPLVSLSLALIAGGAWLLAAGS